MKKLVVTEYVSLDGVFEEPGQWSFPFWSDEAGAFKFGELMASDTQLLGRRTYDGFAKAWPTMEGTGEFGERMNTMPKYVVSTTLTDPTWTNTTVIADDIAARVAALKAGDGGDILVAGSGQLVRFLLEHGLVDELRLMVHPVVLGAGLRLFPDGLNLPKSVFSLAETKPFATGVVVLTYRTAPAS